MKFKAKPHEIEAFRFDNGKSRVPPWFQKLYESGKAMVVMNNKDQYISVETKGGIHKAFLGDWVCMNKGGTVFVLSNAEIEQEFIPIYSDLKNV